MINPLFALAAATAVQAAPQPPLELSCLGAGTANKTVSETVTRDRRVKGPPGTKPTTKTETTTVSRNVKQDFDDQVDVRLFTGDDRIRMPRVMVPELHGGKNGWFRLKNVVADDRSIRAGISLGFLSNPKLFIDRVTGTISISGNAGDYSGQCHAVDANAPTKF